MGPGKRRGMDSSRDFSRGPRLFSAPWVSLSPDGTIFLQRYVCGWDRFLLIVPTTWAQIFFRLLARSYSDPLRFFFSLWVTFMSSFLMRACALRAESTSAQKHIPFFISPLPFCCGVFLGGVGWSKLCPSSLFIPSTAVLLFSPSEMRGALGNPSLIHPDEISNHAL